MDRNTKFVSMGHEWAQIDKDREALFAFVMELNTGKEPEIKTIALTIPNISGQGDPNKALYATRPIGGGGMTAALQPGGGAPAMPEFARKPGLTVVRPEDVLSEDMAEAVETIPFRRNQKKPE